MGGDKRGPGRAADRRGPHAAAGLAAMERAKANGSLEVLDGPERLEVPADLAAGSPPSNGQRQLRRLSSSARKMMLAWGALAQRPETRARRVAEIASAAARASGRGAGGGPARRGARRAAAITSR